MIPPPQDSSSPGTDPQTALPPPHLLAGHRPQTPSSLFPLKVFWSRMWINNWEETRKHAGLHKNQEMRLAEKERQNLISNFGPRVVTSVAAGCGQARRHPPRRLRALPRAEPCDRGWHPGMGPRFPGAAVAEPRGCPLCHPCP